MLWREEHRFHKPPLAFNKRPTYEVHPRPRPIAEEGDRNTLQRREKEIVQTGERKNQKGEGGGGAEETNRDAPSRITLPEGQLPAGDRAERSQSRSCIPLGAARLSDRSERPKSPRTLENLDFLITQRHVFGKQCL